MYTCPVVEKIRKRRKKNMWPSIARMVTHGFNIADGNPCPCSTNLVFFFLSMYSFVERQSLVHSTRHQSRRASFNDHFVMLSLKRVCSLPWSLSPFIIFSSDRTVYLYELGVIDAAGEADGAQLDTTPDRICYRLTEGSKKLWWVQGLVPT